MIKRVCCLLGIFCLLSQVAPCWSQTSNTQGTVSPDNDRMIYPRYDIFGMPLNTRQDRWDMIKNRPGTSSQGPSAKDVGGVSQPASQPASRPASDPATNPASQ